jgi:hypothetical protein
MVDPVSGGTLITGVRMIWAGIQWIVRSRQAPWSIINMSATLSPYISPWYSVRFFGDSEKPFAIDLVSVRTIRPKKLLLCRSDTSGSPGMATGTEAIVLEGLQWTIQEKSRTSMPFQRTIFVKLEGLKGETTIDFELMAHFHDNRRTKVPVWVRTNPVTLK